MLTVPILIPVLTNYPLPLSDMGDILGGGLILTLGSFMITLAGLDSGSAYGGIGSSRAVMLGILAEPTLILVFVGRYCSPLIPIGRMSSSTWWVAFDHAAPLARLTRHQHTRRQQSRGQQTCGGMMHHV